MKQIKLNLDELTDADIISELENRASGGALSRALYRVICEWFVSRPGIVSIQAPNRPESGPDMTESGPDELATALAEIDDSWN